MTDVSQRPDHEALIHRTGDWCRVIFTPLNLDFELPVSELGDLRETVMTRPVLRQAKLDLFRQIELVTAEWQAELGIRSSERPRKIEPDTIPTLQAPGAAVPAAVPAAAFAILIVAAIVLVCVIWGVW